LKSNNNRPNFCLEVWGTDYNKIKDTCILAEKLGYDGFFYGESLADIGHHHKLDYTVQLISRNRQD
jgi:hypothetical protein